eukprot:Seg4113.4 transcript_id=Seg4113.4/GoldUCD/mRNA.D3Y31 product="Xanthine dehydrogenase/oxidase" protein_id=Seg4113.4/GoldUCD/D3Y31
MRTGAQEHFYLETQACLAFPLNENDEMVLYSSTQAPCDTQMIVATALGIPYNRVVCKTKRLGGGFGGKETRASFFAALVAVTATKVGKPVRLMLDRDKDMMLTGYRHPFLAKYKVGFNKDGRVQVVDMDLFANAGWSSDLSIYVTRKAILLCANSYSIPNYKVRGRNCKTNLPSNTAFRGFGGKQGMMMSETWIHDIATMLERDPAEIRKLNMYEPGEMTLYKQKMENSGLHRCWEQCLKQSNYEEAKQSIVMFNNKSRWKKRGIAIIPVTYGIGFEAAFMNQGGSSNVRAVYSSKAVGEPPLFLAASVFFAIKDAIQYARTNAGHQGIFQLEAPATAERIRMACKDEITNLVPEIEEGSFVPWSLQV